MSNDEVSVTCPVIKVISVTCQVTQTVSVTCVLLCYCLMAPFEFLRHIVNSFMHDSSLWFREV